MKNMITTCIIFFLMIFILFFASKYIVLTCDKLLDVSSEIEENIVNNNWDESYMLSFELLNIYEGHVANLTLFLNHTDFDNIYSEVIKLSQYSKCKNKDEALSSIHVVKTLINQVKELESISIGNIF
ncbi:hypothetical protein IO99_08985 [Clostridium sulfidigenes]|uniref:DUF4363 domain-containing protein n=1 Tax=Clostridium sulfidigenes TaxID=318464 RepID=A0A084JCC1_9CLOT|nr:DUF4363 family protein [Clostridium sulfidigenes]KEZ86605.1 hypothetical protein IO99_08985 [Clostridium sulfidigenes]HBA04427.1 DUF4363 domain-containing protein [Clostridium sp.]HCO73723.1 DUF4363 domain-containing protein [Clostridium sp.]